MSGDLTPGQFVEDFLDVLRVLDDQWPVWKTYQPGIGPHPETEVVRSVAAQLAMGAPELYGPHSLGFPCPAARRQKCDWVIGSPPSTAIEVKLLRMLGDNGKPNDNMLMHILSPYPAHRSALTDCSKLARSRFGRQVLLLIYGFEYQDWPMDPAIEAFEVLARRQVRLSQRSEGRVEGLLHPVHRCARAFCWAIGELR